MACFVFLWVPACAGMTGECAGMTVGVCGNDGWGLGLKRASTSRRFRFAKGLLLFCGVRLSVVLRV